ncbi:hypothetical protein ACOSQ3_031829 [Xanthoceras sorbifolium]
MINPNKLIKTARKWQRIACHFVVYTNDQRRFIFPISYLSNCIFQELLRMSEDEFGLPNNGPITLPCDAIFMEYAVSLIQGCVDRHLQEALLMSVPMSKCSQSPSQHHYGQTSQQLLVCSC